MNKQTCDNWQVMTIIYLKDNLLLHTIVMKDNGNK